MILAIEMSVKDLLTIKDIINGNIDSIIKKSEQNDLFISMGVLFENTPFEHVGYFRDCGFIVRKGE